LKYRAEIDGLRALAVVPVILFHAGFELFSGGFVGVDVFFVISGYLITTILIEDVKSNTFSIVKFYQRRVRRILPALITVCLATIPLSYIYLDPVSFTDFGKSLLSVSAFVSNIYFALSGGYFAEYVAAKPLLHSWSLSVEEQFYIVFPLIVLMCSRFRVLNLTAIISVLSLLSITLAILLVEVYPRIAFFGLPTRAWELELYWLL
jgi:peptidoglycan/LPS O-acetylase OafA/YrhL